MLFRFIHFVFVVIYNGFLCDEIIFNIWINKVHQAYVEGIIGGTKSQLIRIDIQKPYSFVFSNCFCKYNKSSIYSTNGIIRNYSIEWNGIESQDILEISNMKMSNFIFIYQEGQLFQSELTPFLGFGRGEQSLINQLYNNKLIHHKNFGFFSEENNSQNLKMFIGRKLSDNPKYKCKMLKDFSEGYSCTLSSIGPLSNNADLKIKINKTVIFETSLPISIVFPYKYLDEFYKSYFTEKFFKENCKLIEAHLWNEIYCKTNKIKELPDLLLNFGGVYVLIPPIKLFREIYEVDTMKAFRIEFYGLSDFTEIYFGGWFVEQNLLAFDVDNENIIFQGHNFQIFTDFSKTSFYSETKLLIVLCIYNLSFGVIYIVFKNKLILKYFPN